MSLKGLALADRLLRYFNEAEDCPLKTSALLRAYLRRRPVADEGERLKLLRILTRPAAGLKAFEGLLPGISEPPEEVVRSASLDYARCLLAKAMHDAARDQLRRLKTKKAREAFFEDLSLKANTIHLSTSSEALLEFLGQEPAGEFEGKVHVLLRTMLDEGYGLREGHETRVQSANYEFRAFLDRLEKITGEAWEGGERYDPNISVSSFFNPFIDEGPELMLWGAQHIPQLSIINVNPPVLFLSALRRGVLARQAALLLTPTVLEVVDSGRLAVEQAEYLAYKVMGGKYDRELWVYGRHGPRKETRVGGEDLIEFFRYHEMLGGATLYRQMWERLKAWKAPKLTRSDYFSILGNITGAPRPFTPDRLELKALKALIKQPRISYTELAKELNVSAAYGFIIFERVVKKAAVLFNGIVNPELIGLKEFAALIKAENLPDTVKILHRFRYCLQAWRIYGPYDILAIMVLPEEHVSFPDVLLDKMRKEKLIDNYILGMAQKSLFHASLDRFDERSMRWDIRWDLWAAELRERLLTKPTTPQAERLVKPKARLDLDKVDMIILDRLGLNCRTLTKKLAALADVNPITAAKKARRLLEEGVLIPAARPYRVGAEELAVALEADRGVCELLADSFNELPMWRGYIVSGGFDGLIASTWVPMGHSRLFFKAIEDELLGKGLAKRAYFHATGAWLIGRGLPVGPLKESDLYTADGKWVFEEEKYLSF